MNIKNNYIRIKTKGLIPINEEKVLTKIALKNGNFWEKEYYQNDKIENIINDFREENNEDFPEEYIAEWKNKNQSLEMNEKIKTFIIKEIPSLNINNKNVKKSLILEEEESIPNIIGKPFNNPFEIFTFCKKDKLLKIQRYNKEIIEKMNLNDIESSYAYCNGNNYLFISGGENKNLEIIQKFWKINLENQIINCFDMIPKKNHSMIYIPGNYIFIVGGNDLKTIYYDLIAKEFTEWGDLNNKRIEPSLALINNDLYCFDNSSSKNNNEYFSLEKTGMTSEKAEWVLINPILNQPKINQKFFGAIKNDVNTILFIGGNMNEEENKNKFNYQYNIYLNTIGETDIPFKEFNLKEKTFLPYNENIYYIIPDFNRHHPEIIFYQKNKKKLNFVKYEPEHHDQNQKYINNNNNINIKVNKDYKYNLNMPSISLHKKEINNNNNEENNNLNIMEQKIEIKEPSFPDINFNLKTKKEIGQNPPFKAPEMNFCNQDMKISINVPFEIPKQEINIINNDKKTENKIEDKHNNMNDININNKYGENNDINNNKEINNNLAYDENNKDNKIKDNLEIEIEKNIINKNDINNLNLILGNAKFNIDKNEENIKNNHFSSDLNSKNNIPTLKSHINAQNNIKENINDKNIIYNPREKGNNPSNNNKIIPSSNINKNTKKNNKVNNRNNNYSKPVEVLLKGTIPGINSNDTKKETKSIRIDIYREKTPINANRNFINNNKFDFKKEKDINIYGVIYGCKKKEIKKPNTKENIELKLKNENKINIKNSINNNKEINQKNNPNNNLKEQNFKSQKIDTSGNPSGIKINFPKYNIPYETNININPNNNQNNNLKDILSNKIKDSEQKNSEINMNNNNLKNNNLDINIRSPKGNIINLQKNDSKIQNINNINTQKLEGNKINNNRNMEINDEKFKNLNNKNEIKKEIKTSNLKESIPNFYLVGVIKGKKEYKKMNKSEINENKARININKSKTEIRPEKGNLNNLNPNFNLNKNIQGNNFKNTPKMNITNIDIKKQDLKNNINLKINNPEIKGLNSDLNIKIDNIYNPYEKLPDSKINGNIINNLEDLNKKAPTKEQEIYCNGKIDLLKENKEIKEGNIGGELKIMDRNLINLKLENNNSFDMNNNSNEGNKNEKINLNNLGDNYISDNFKDNNNYNENLMISGNGEIKNMKKKGISLPIVGSKNKNFELSKTEEVGQLDVNNINLDNLKSSNMRINGPIMGERIIK